MLTLDPHAQNHSTTNAMMQHAYEGLTRYDRDYKVEPALATGWQQTSPTEWRFNLRRNVRFHDGAPFTADDVVFSIQRALEKTSDFSAYMQGIEGAKARGGSNGRYSARSLSRMASWRCFNARSIA